MKPKKIKKKLKDKLNKFVESINDPKLKKLIKENTIITGGAIANMFLGEPVNDYDLYFTDKETVIDVAEYFCKKAKKDGVADMFILHGDTDIVKAVANLNISILQESINTEIKNNENDELSFNCPIELFDSCPKEVLAIKTEYNLSWRLIHNIYHTFKNDMDRVKVYSDGSWGVNGCATDDEKIDSQEVESEQDEKYEVKFISANAITLSDKMQLIIRFYGDAKEIHSNFDYVHATCYWTSCDNELYTKSEALEALLGKYLIYKGSKYPLASIFRARKFIYRGWTIDAGQYLKMVFQLNELDLHDIYILEEQLTGVDLLYFNQIVNDMKFKQMKDADFNASTDYFIKIIEKIFE